MNMRLRSREISREVVYESVGRYEIIEAYPQDKSLPSYLLWTRHASGVVHVLFAVDIAGGNVRVVTAYRPGPMEWTDGLKRRSMR